MPEKTNQKKQIERTTTEIPRSAKIVLNLKRQKMVLTIDLTWNTENLSSCIKLFLLFLSKDQPPGDSK